MLLLRNPEDYVGTMMTAIKPKLDLGYLRDGNTSGKINMIDRELNNSDFSDNFQSAN